MKGSQLRWPSKEMYLVLPRPKGSGGRVKKGPPNLLRVEVKWPRYLFLKDGESPATKGDMIRAYMKSRAMGNKGRWG